MYQVLTIGDLVFIEEMEENEVVYYKARLVDIVKNEIHLDIPINENTGKNGVFTRDTEYKVLFLTKNSLLYSCMLTFKHFENNNVPVMVFPKPDQKLLKLEQRRQFFRIATTTEITIQPNSDEFQAFKTLSQDISAGGVAIHAPISIPFTKDQFVMLNMNLRYENAPEEELNVEAKIVRITDSEHPSKQLLSFEFHNLQNQARQKIIKYTLEQQRLFIQSKKQNV